jgi:exocyst complex component 4
MKQSDILQIWAKSIQYREMLKILDTVESFSRLPAKVDKLIEDKHYLVAVRYLLNSGKVLNGRELCSIGALSDVKRNIQYKIEVRSIYTQLKLKAF